MTTGVQPDGAYDFLVSALGGPGVERHLHGYAWLDAGGRITAGGARLKEDIRKHLGEGIVLSNSTQEIARLVVTREEGKAGCVIKQLIDDTWMATSASTIGGPMRRVEIKLPGSSTANGAEYSLAMFDARSGVPSDTSTSAVVLFGDGVAFGFTVNLVRSW